MKIRSKEYCEACPWYNSDFRWLEMDSSYWKEHVENCMCLKCPARGACMRYGPEKRGDCIGLSSHHGHKY
jgi:hypothetical protein